MDAINPPGRIELVVFDLGRVLVRICDDWFHACSCAGLDVSRDSIRPETLPRLRELAEQAEVGRLGIAEFAERASPLIGISPRQFRLMSEAFILGPYPGAVDIVSELTQSGIATACLTNTNDDHWALLSRNGHQAYFPLDRLKHQFASHLVRARKPMAAIYEHVERETKVSGDRILFFDDVLENVEAARKRGWHAQRIDPALSDPIAQIRSALARHQLGR